MWSSIVMLKHSTVYVHVLNDEMLNDEILNDEMLQDLTTIADASHCTYHKANRCKRKERNVSFNDSLNTFYLWLTFYL